jgi:release factor glutamine methyltransferase
VDEAQAAARLRAAGCVFAEEEARLITSAAATPAELAGMVARRAGGLPLEQVVGWAEFCGLRIAVEPGVFVPRLRTEFLVGEAVRLIRAASAGPPDDARPEARRARPALVVDLCCGTGAIGAAIAAAVHAADIDPAAARCARRNVPGTVYQGDLYDPLPAGLRGQVTLLTANVPYVPTGEIGFLPPEARDHEPRVTLDGGPDGLHVLRRVAAGAPGWLAPGGHLVIETSSRQVPGAAAVFAGAGLLPRVASDDELGATVVIGTWPGPAGTASSVTGGSEPGEQPA